MFKLALVCLIVSFGCVLDCYLLDCVCACWFVGLTIVLGVVVVRCVVKRVA